MRDVFGLPVGVGEKRTVPTSLLQQFTRCDETAVQLCAARVLKKMAAEGDAWFVSNQEWTSVVESHSAVR